MSHLPNIITALRMVSVLPLIWLLAHEHYTAALWLAFIAGASDAVDGLLAKQFGWTSRLGGILDPLADKLLLIACYGMLGLKGILPLWLFWLVVGRDVVIILGATAYHFLVEPVEGEPTMVSKINTTVQIVAVLWVLVDIGWTTLPQPVTGVLILAVTLTTIASGLDYVIRWSYRTWKARTTPP